MWTKRPRGQIAKCAAAQALRIAFPEIASQPTADEMEGKALQVDESLGDLPSICPPELLTQAQAAADGGRDAFASFWKHDLNGAKRNQLAPHLADLKERTDKAEAKKAATVIDAESGEILNETTGEPTFGDVVDPA
jgi:hypothetical protein